MSEVGLATMRKNKRFKPLKTLKISKIPKLKRKMQKKSLIMGLSKTYLLQITGSQQLLQKIHL